MDSLRFDLKMYRSLLRITVKGMMQYRADFWASLIGVFVLNAANVIQMSVIAWRFGALGTWGVGDLMVLYGMYMISFSIYSVFFRRVLSLETEIVNGTFDKYLLRPTSPFIQLIGGEIQYVGLCDTLLGVLLLVSGLGMAQIHWTVADYGWLAVYLLSGGTVITCIYLLIACVTFWVIKASALSSVLTQLSLLTQKYPISIFGTPFRVLVTGVVPIAFMNFYPAAMLLRKTDAPRWVGMLSPLVAVGLVGLASLVWKKGVRRYGSSGS